MAHTVPPNQSALQDIYNAEVALGLLRSNFVTQNKPDTYRNYYTCVTLMTALQTTLLATDNWSNVD